MKEKEHLSASKGGIEFGQPLKKRQRQSVLFPEGEDLPLLSGTPQAVIDTPFVPEDQTWKQEPLPGMPGIDYERVLEKDQELRRRRHHRPVIGAAVDLFIAEQNSDNDDVHHEPRNEPEDDDERVSQLREALAPYLDVRLLRRFAARPTLDLHEAILAENPPQEVFALLDLLGALLRPARREQITGPAEMAALLMVEMSHLTQEQLRLVCLNTRNHVQKIQLVYQGSLNTSPIRIAEVFREPLRLNSAAIITAHNHPSGDPSPSTEDIAVTRQIVAAGKLLDIEVLDHLVIGQGRWVSLRERGLGFETVWPSIGI